MNDKRLPPVSLPEELYELIRLYAFRTNKRSISAAVRDLLSLSPELRELAKEQGVDLDNLNVGSWGGKRK